MSDAANSDAQLSLKVMVNRKENKFLYAEADSSFADVLISFLTLPLGSIVKILKKHYGDEAPTFGSLNTLYNGLANLDTAHFWTEGAKSILLHPRSSFDAKCKMLKLDISDSPPLEYFVCGRRCVPIERIQSVSVSNDNPGYCPGCNTCPIVREEAKTVSQTVPCLEGAFMAKGAVFFIAENLKMVPMGGLLQIVSDLGITDMSEAETMDITFGFSEVMDLLKAVLISSTPLSDIVLKRKGDINSTARKCEERTSSDYQVEGSPNCFFKLKILKVMVQKSTNKFLYAEAGEDFVNFLFSFLTIPLGGVERILKGKSLIKGTDALYSSVCKLIGNKYFKDYGTKEKLIEFKVLNGYIPFSNELFCSDDLPHIYSNISWNRSIKLPKGDGKFVIGPKTYKVADDLTVTPFCFVSILSWLKEQNIAISDVEEVNLEIGKNEVLSIVKASLTSTTALTDALLTQVLSKKQVKRERDV